MQHLDWQAGVGAVILGRLKRATENVISVARVSNLDTVRYSLDGWPCLKIVGPQKKLALAKLDKYFL